jgi:Uma2 family endonuclease
MPTILKLSPRDHGRRVPLEEFEAAQWEEGYRYELIDGKLHVSPLPNLPHDVIVVWITEQLLAYRLAHPDVLNYVSGHARVFVPGRPGVTNPEPDLAAYRDYPLGLPLGQRRWQNMSPILVTEVVSEEDPDKDLERNVELYGQVPSIREYWILDPRTNADAPSLRVYRRRGRSWQRPIDVDPGESYTTRLLPDFTLRLDPLG